MGCTNGKTFIDEFAKTATIEAEIEAEIEAASRAAQAKLKRAFETAWTVNLACNKIFAIPLSFMFCACFVAAAPMWYLVVVSEVNYLLPQATIIPVMALILLIFTSTAGDAYVDARDSLLRPDVSLGLAKHAGLNEAAVFAGALQRTTLGFKIVNVTVTTHRVLHVIGSMLVLGVYLMPK